MRPSRVFRLLFRIFVSLLTLSITVVSLLGFLSAVTILSNPNNIRVNPGDFDLQYSIFPLNINFTLPFNLTNAGYFDLENLNLKIDLAMNYSHVDGGGPGVNETRVINIFNKSQYFGNIPQGATGTYNYTGLFSDFYFPPPAEFNFTSSVDWYRGTPAILFYANFTISLDYSLGLHSLIIGINYPNPVGGI